MYKAFFKPTEYDLKKIIEKQDFKEKVYAVEIPEQHLTIDNHVRNGERFIKAKVRFYSREVDHRE